MKVGSIVLTPLPQADGQVKNRPALVLARMQPFDDLLVCGISTQLHLAVSDFDEVIARADPDFSTAGLMAPSLIRLGFISTIPITRVKGTIGIIQPIRYRRLNKKLIDYLAAIPSA
jgi:mRNA interferase MazF